MNVWSLLKVALLGLSVWTGYSEMAPEKLAHSNPDVIFCTVTLVGTIAFSFAAVWYSISGARQQTLRRASRRRFSINWWHDPLQWPFSFWLFRRSYGFGSRVPRSRQFSDWLLDVYVFRLPVSRASYRSARSVFCAS
jgi:hypothetical protein